MPRARGHRSPSESCPIRFPLSTTLLSLSLVVHWYYLLPTLLKFLLNVFCAYLATTTVPPPPWTPPWVERAISASKHTRAHSSSPCHHREQHGPGGCAASVHPAAPAPVRAARPCVYLTSTSIFFASSAAGVVPYIWLWFSHSSRRAGISARAAV